MKILNVYIVITVLVGVSYLMLSFMNNDSLKIEKGEIAPFEKWHEIVIGKWDFLAELKELDEIHVYKGKVEYREDSTVTWYLNLEYYDHYSNEAKQVEKDKYTLNLKGGIIRNCTWFAEWLLDDSYQWFDNGDCTCQEGITFGETPDGRDLCDYIPLWDTGTLDGIFFGPRENGAFHVEPIQFNKDKIVILEKDIGANTDNFYTFTRNHSNFKLK